MSIAITRKAGPAAALSGHYPSVRDVEQNDGEGLKPL